ncbi:MAG: glycosyltransferase family 39 protein [Bacteroidales bacterium]
MSRRSFWIITAATILLELFLHMITAGNYQLHRDEMLYFAMGSHPDWGFASTPPAMSFLAFLIKSVAGYNEVAVKFFPALAGAVILLLIALSIRELGGGRMALLTACLAFLCSTAMLRTCSLFMPVVFELLFWTLFLYSLLLLIHRQDPKFWIAAGISFGLAFLNKYSILVLGSSVIISLLLTRQRRLLWSAYVPVAAGCALIIMLPNILWQFRHNFAVYTHMQELYRTQLVNVAVGTFLLEQLLGSFSALPVWLAGVVGLLFIRAERQYRLFSFLFLLVLVFFLLLKGKPYYTLGIYPMMFAFGGWILEKYFRKMIPSVLVFVLLFGLLNLPFGLMLLPQGPMEKYCQFTAKYITAAPMRGEQNQYYPLPQDYMDMTGWQELAGLVNSVYGSLSEKEKGSCTIYANNYGQAAAIDFYGKQYGLPPAVCLNDSYVLWAPDSIGSENFIVSDHQLGDIPRLFGSFTKVGEIHNPYFRENGLKVYLCRDPKPELNDFFISRIREKKAIYGF